MIQMPSSISTRLQYQHKTVLDLIEGLSDEQIRRSPEPGKWSVFEIIVHLQTYQHTFINRVKNILEQDNPVFERYTAEADPLFHDQCGKSTREVMHDLLVTRKTMSAEMINFKPEDFCKTGIHPVFGTLNILQWINFFLLHEAHHLFVIFKLTAGLTKESLSAGG